MARYGKWHPGDREIEPTIVVPNPTVYTVGMEGEHRPRPRIRERVQPISRDDDRRRTYGIDVSQIDVARRRTGTPPPPVVIRVDK